MAGAEPVFPAYLPPAPASAPTARPRVPAGRPAIPVATRTAATPNRPDLAFLMGVGVPHERTPRKSTLKA